ncbi:MAG: DMT family transporter [Rhodocyclaceae bacterium]
MPEQNSANAPRAGAGGDHATGAGRSTSRLIVALLTSATMLAFAANSLLARLAFRNTAIDPASFTLVRIVSGAGVLALVLAHRRERVSSARDALPSAFLLFVYAAAFSFAYRGISIGAGALVLFACAQLVMIGFGYARGERTHIFGLSLAVAGLAAFLLPGASAPAPLPAGLMALAGTAWGGFSLLARASGTPVGNTASSFIWAVPLSLALLLIEHGGIHLDPMGLLYAVVSGALASAVGYVVWYWVRVRMTAIAAGSVQLSVPVLSAVLGVALLGEQLTWQRWLAGGAVLLGVAITSMSTSRRRDS